MLPDTPQDDGLLRIGDKFQKYKVTGFLGSGGQAYVYEGLDEYLDRRVAIKIIPQPREQKRALQEARALLRLKHPNIVAFIDGGPYGESAMYLLMERLEGCSLRATLARYRRLTILETLTIAIQVAEALHVAHKAHIIHRDIKPENIFVEPENVAKVLDFGVARLVVGGIVTTDRDRIRGTVSYMSPEQLLGKGAIAASDFYALGTMMYEALAGEHPVAIGAEELTMQAVMGKQLYVMPPRLEELDKRIPQYVANLVRVLIAKDPNKRYATAREVLKALEICRRRYESECGTNSEALTLRELWVPGPGGEQSADDPRAHHPGFGRSTAESGERERESESNQERAPGRGHTLQLQTVPDAAAVLPTEPAQPTEPVLPTEPLPPSAAPQLCADATSVPATPAAHTPEQPTNSRLEPNAPSSALERRALTSSAEAPRSAHALAATQAASGVPKRTGHLSQPQSSQAFQLEERRALTGGAASPTHAARHSSAPEIAEHARPSSKADAALRSSASSARIISANSQNAGRELGTRAPLLQLALRELRTSTKLFASVAALSLLGGVAHGLIRTAPMQTIPTSDHANARAVLPRAAPSTAATPVPRSDNPPRALPEGPPPVASQSSAVGAVAPSPLRQPAPAIRRRRNVVVASKKPASAEPNALLEEAREAYKVLQADTKREAASARAAPTSSRTSPPRANSTGAQPAQTGAP